MYSNDFRETLVLISNHNSFCDSNLKWLPDVISVQEESAHILDASEFKEQIYR